VGNHRRLYRLERAAAERSDRGDHSDGPVHGRVTGHQLQGHPARRGIQERQEPAATSSRGTSPRPICLASRPRPVPVGSFVSRPGRRIAQSRLAREARSASVVPLARREVANMLSKDANYHSTAFHNAPMPYSVFFYPR
jgi:hypothetical protein